MKPKARQRMLDLINAMNLTPILLEEIREVFNEALEDSYADGLDYGYETGYKSGYFQGKEDSDALRIN